MIINEAIVVAIITAFSTALVALLNNTRNVSKKEFDEYQARRSQEMSQLESKLDNLSTLTTAVATLTEQNKTLFNNNKDLKNDVDKIDVKIDNLREAILKK